jgi:hypothetical protein
MGAYDYGVMGPSAIERLRIKVPAAHAAGPACFEIVGLKLEKRI